MKTVLNLGMGADSATILVRWLDNAAARAADGVDLADLIVLVSMTGNEFDSTRALVEQHLLPRLREHNVRTVQVCRADRAGHLCVLDDSQQPQAVHFRGRYTLSQEWEASGTIQFAGGANRLCSVHAKGEVLDQWLLQEFGDRPFRHVIGFECTEGSRAKRDAEQTRDLQPKKAARMPNRRPWYPLIEWGWDRPTCISYLQEQTGVEHWEKSCCGFCPYAGQNKAGRADLIRRFKAEPARAAEALWLEFIALAFHDGAKLYKTTTVREVCEQEQCAEALGLFARQVNTTPEWAVYRVGRAWSGAAVPPRSVTIEATGSRTDMLRAQATFGKVEVDAQGIGRVHIARRPEAPKGGKRIGHEEYLVVAPKVVHEKVNRSYHKAVAKLQGRGPSLAVI